MDYSKVETNALIKMGSKKAQEFMLFESQGKRARAEEARKEAEAIAQELENRGATEPHVDMLIEQMKDTPTEELVIKYSLTKALGEMMDSPEKSRLMKSAEEELRRRGVNPDDIVVLDKTNPEPQKIFEEKPKPTYNKELIKGDTLPEKFTFHDLMNMNEARVLKEGEPK